MEKLTKKEAIEKGYWLCGYAEREYQTLMSIEDIDDDNFKMGEIVLADKDDIMTPSISADRIKEMIADSMESDWGNDTGDDTEEVYDKVMSLDFTATANMINEALNNKKSYTLTTIVLVPDSQ